jgi:hypothetical protein
MKKISQPLPPPSTWRQYKMDYTDTIEEPSENNGGASVRVRGAS